MATAISWPTGLEYREVVQNIGNSVGDEELRAGEPARNARGMPLLWAGNFADVYRIDCPATGKTWALKCFTREVRGHAERYRIIAEHLEKAKLPFTVEFQFLEQGVRVRGQWFPSLKMRWVEGLTLNRFVEQSLEKPKMLGQLLALWPKLANRLRGAGIAHADLQHGNVLLVPTAEGGLALKLIDYDGMFVEKFAGSKSGELGHPAYQHPQRLRLGTYNADVDRFSHLAIYCAVHCLKVGRDDLWRRFNNEDNLLFRERDFQDPGASEVFHALWELRDNDARSLVGHLALACRQPLEEVPWLDDVVVRGRVRALSGSEQRAVAEMLAAGSVSRRPVGAGGAVGAQGGTVGVHPPHEQPRGSASLVNTRPVTVEGTVPARGTAPIIAETASGTGEATNAPREALPRGSARASLAARAARALAGAVVYTLAVVPRTADRLLGWMVGADNAILHNFLRVAAVVSTAVIAGWWFTRVPGLEEEIASTTADVPINESISSAETKRVSLLEGRKNDLAAHMPPSLLEKEIALQLGNDVDLELVRIPAGEFLMGSQSALPVHKVCITRPFYLGKYEVTQQQWQAMLGDNPSSLKGRRNPVEQVSWEDCQTFLAKLNQRFSKGTGRFVLPTEAQWEYACRAGSATEYCFGDGVAALGDYAWYGGDSWSNTHPVGEKQPNAWGLYDMYGNVAEWCADWLDGRYYAKSSATDPMGPLSGWTRVYRGGGVRSQAADCCSAYRGGNSPKTRGVTLGLRVALIVTDGSPPLVPLRLQSIARQRVVADKPLTLVASVENAADWAGKVRYCLADPAPLGARIDPQSGEFSWSPPANRTTETYDVTVLAESADGRSDRTTFMITVARSLSLPPRSPLRLPTRVIPGQKEFVVDLGNGVTMQMLLIPAGSAVMGAELSPPPAMPLDLSRITRPYYLGKYEVTQEQWEAVMGNNPSNFKGPKNPVEQVSWNDCQMFVTRLNSGFVRGDGSFALPTDVQWEHACRAESKGAYCFGDDEASLGQYAWYGGNSEGKTHPVGEKQPNTWGLYDVHGNVWEWCAGNPGPTPVLGSGLGLTSASVVVRGGCWEDAGHRCQSMVRNELSPENRATGLGLRVCWNPSTFARESVPAPLEKPLPRRTSLESLVSNIDLPEIPSGPESEGPVGESRDLGEVRLQPGEKLDIRLLGGKTALKGGYQFDIDPAKSVNGKTVWSIHFKAKDGSRGNSEQTSVAEVSQEGDLLQFHWLAGANKVKAGHLSNCGLQFAVGGATHWLPLCRPMDVEPIVLDLERGERRAIIALKNPPDPSALRLKVTGLEGPFPQHVTKASDTARILGKNEKGTGNAVIAIRVTDAYPVTLQMQMSLKGTNVALTLDGDFTLDYQHRLPFSKKGLLGAVPMIRSREGSSSTSSSVRREKEARDRLFALGELAKTLHDSGKICYRVYIDCEGKEIDLAVTDAPAGGGKPASPRLPILGPDAGEGVGPGLLRPRRSPR